MIIQTLAAAYFDAICDAVTTEELAEIKLGKSVHDFVDGNHYLLAAYEDMLGHEALLDENDFRIFHEAEEYAHQHFFK
jgi:hypothetical protein